jgi:hypothetical protein
MYLIWHTKIMGRMEARSAGKNWDEIEEDRVGSQNALSAGKPWRGATQVAPWIYRTLFCLQGNHADC